MDSSTSTQDDSSTSLADSDSYVEKLVRENNDLFERNQALADAVVNSAEIIDELEQTKQQLAEAQRSAEQARQSAQRMSATIFEGTQDAMLVLDSDLRVVAANKNAWHMFEIQDANSNFVEYLKRQYRTADGGDWFATFKPESQTQSNRIELFRDLPDSKNARRWIEFSMSVLPCEGAGQRYLVSSHDITKRKEIESLIHHQAYHDNVTQLPNRRFFVQKVEELMSSEDVNKFAICFLDLDNFKTVNDTLGHEAGDQLLVQVARRIQTTTRDDCHLARFGGDEFALLVPNLEVDNVDVIANRIVSKLQEPFEINGHSVYVGASIGMTEFPDDGTDVSDLLQNADVAMYSAKENGRNRFHQFTPELGARLRQRQALLEQIREVVKHREVTLAYQPKWSVQEDRFIGCEALLRWQFEGRNIPPEIVIEAAECAGLIFPLGEIILETAMRQMVEWREEIDSKATIAINLSTRQLTDPHFIESFQKTAARTGIEPSRVELEITETAAMKDLEVAFSTLQTLQNLGVAIAIDDFGTGYSSLSYLKTLPISTLKIDRSFVSDVPNDSKAVAVAKTILSLGHGLGLQVVAEGVETEEQLRFLQESGCDQIQGYILSAPLDSLEFPEWVRSKSGLPPISAI